MRQHTSAYVSIEAFWLNQLALEHARVALSIRQHVSANVSIRLEAFRLDLFALEHARGSFLATRPCGA